MKRHGHLYEQIYDFENLYLAYLEARSDKRYRSEVLEFSANLEERLIQIQNELIWKTYEVGRYREFYLHEPKKRLIMALPFKDRVVQWAIYRVLNPIYDSSFISHSYGCRINKGTHRAANCLQRWLREADRSPGKTYYLKMDISKYFYRVDHDIIIWILRKKIKDENLISLLELIIRSETVAFGLPLHVEPGGCPDNERLYNKGMPIGNLVSQLIANIYLNELDQFCKHELGIKRYIRYMDDFIVLSKDKKYLHWARRNVEHFLNDVLILHLNSKTRVDLISAGVEFVGYRIWPTHKLMKKSSAKRMKRRLKYLQKAHLEGRVKLNLVNATVQSYLGILEHSNSYHLEQIALKMLEAVKLQEEIKSEKINTHD